MNIIVYTHEENASSVLNNVKDYFSQEFPEEEIKWETTHTMLRTSLPISETEITRVFEELVKKYPQLDVEASYSYDIREDDRSAQWWGTTNIYSEWEDGEVQIVSRSSTYWN